MRTVNVSRVALEELLQTTISRGESLGFVEADEDYRQWLRMLKANRPTPNAVDLAAQVGEGGEFHIEYLEKDVVRLTPQGN